MKNKTLYGLIFIPILLLISCATPAPGPAVSQPTEELMSLVLTSDAFMEGQAIPAKFTCRGTLPLQDISPPLTWSEPPDGTRSFALVMDDPDAPGGTWVHWVYLQHSCLRTRSA